VTEIVEFDEEALERNKAICRMAGKHPPAFIAAHFHLTVRAVNRVINHYREYGAFA